MRIELNDGWEFTPRYNEELSAPIYKVGDTVEVRIPHSVKITPFSFFDSSEYEMVSGYRKVLSLPREWEGKRLILTFDAVAHCAEVLPSISADTLLSDVRSPITLPSEEITS